LSQPDSGAGKLLPDYGDGVLLIGGRERGGAAAGGDSSVGHVLGEIMRLGGPHLGGNLGFRLGCRDFRAEGVGQALRVGGDQRYQRRIPRMMQAGGRAVDADLLGVSARVIAASGGMQRLVDIADEMDQEGQRLQPGLVGLGFIRQYRLKIVDLGQHAVVGASRVHIRGGRISQWNRDVHKVPGSGAGGRIRVGEDLLAVGIQGRAAGLEIPKFVRAGRYLRQGKIAKKGLDRAELAGLSK